MSAEPIRLYPGCELDSLVATVVMRWRMCGLHEPFANHRAAGGLVFMATGPEIFDGNKPVPRPWLPSIMIEDAWVLVEKFELAVCPARDVDGRPGWYSGRSVPLGGNPADWWFADTAPVAICGAALRLSGWPAVESVVDQIRDAERQRSAGAAAGT